MEQILKRSQQTMSKGRTLQKAIKRVCTGKMAGNDELLIDTMELHNEPIAELIISIWTIGNIETLQSTGQSRSNQISKNNWGISRDGLEEILPIPTNPFTFQESTGSETVIIRDIATTPSLVIGAMIDQKYGYDKVPRGVNEELRRHKVLNSLHWASVETIDPVMVVAKRIDRDIAKDRMKSKGK